MNRPAEVAISFTCEGEPMLGIVSPAAQPGPVGVGVGVVIVVGGPQYRAGSHRQFVELARSLAAAGFPVLRFDCRGMGDSGGALRDFEHAGADIDAAIGAAIAAFQATHAQVKRVVLWGLCDGASAALLYLHDKPDPRVAGLALLNPWVRSEASLAKTHVKHYYLQRLREREFWRKLASGKVAFGALAGLLRNVRAAFGPGSQASSVGPSAPYQQRMAQAWAAFKGPTLLLLSEFDYTAREFVEFTSANALWVKALHQRPPARVDVLGADHTCSAAASRRTVEAATAEWLAQSVAGHS